MIKSKVSFEWIASLFPFLNGGLVILLACLSLFGWAVQNEVLIRVFPQGMAMNPTTAASFLIVSFALLLSVKKEGKVYSWRYRSPLVMTAIFIVAFVASIRLLDYLFGWDSGIDHLLFSSRIDSTQVSLPNSMAPNTAFSFLLACSSLLFIDARYRTWVIFSQGAVLWMVLTAFVSLVGYSVGAPALYQPLPFVGMAVHTALCFLFLGLAILGARNDRGLAAIVTSPHLGGTMARRLLPMAIASPLIIVWLLILGNKAGFYTTSTGIGLLIVSSLILLVSVTLSTCASLNKNDRERWRTQKEATSTAQRLEHALDISGAAIVTVDEDEKIIFFDRSARKLFGFRSKEILRSRLTTLLPDITFGRSKTNKVITVVRPPSQKKRGRAKEFRAIRKDGSSFFAEAVVAESDRTGRNLITVVIRDISERKRAEDEILKQERLTAANKELESFSYSVSHDLRAPLRHVDGFVELLQKRTVGILDEKSQYYLTTISNSAKQMGNLIDDLLSFSRMTRTEMSQTPTNLNALVQKTIDEHLKGTNGRKIDWSVHDLPIQECDPAMMKQVYSNLIGNAIKFTKKTDQATIEIGALDTQGPNSETVYYVRDNGVGFDTKYKDKLFGVFQRLHRKEDFEGTGIGLANVRRIIRRHGGDAWAEGEVGIGATFFFSLPNKTEAAE